MEPNFAEAIEVGSVAEEYLFLHRQRCACGGRFRPLQQMLIQKPGGRAYDRLRVRCILCGAEREYLFDVAKFYGRGT